MWLHSDSHPIPQPLHQSPFVILLLELRFSAQCPMLLQEACIGQDHILHSSPVSSLIISHNFSTTKRGCSRLLDVPRWPLPVQRASLPHFIFLPTSVLNFACSLIKTAYAVLTINPRHKTESCHLQHWESIPALTHAATQVDWVCYSSVGHLDHVKGSTLWWETICWRLGVGRAGPSHSFCKHSPAMLRYNTHKCCPPSVRWLARTCVAFAGVWSLSLIPRHSSPGGRGEREHKSEVCSVTGQQHCTFTKGLSETYPMHLT